MSEPGLRWRLQQTPLTMQICHAAALKGCCGAPIAEYQGCLAAGNLMLCLCQQVQHHCVPAVPAMQNALEADEPVD